MDSIINNNNIIDPSSTTTTTNSGQQLSPDSPTNLNSISPTATTTNPQSATKRYRAQPPKTFQCRGYGDCKMVFSRSEHLARHVRKHTGERPFTCHCSKHFSRLDNLRQHAQTVHADKVEQNEALMRELSTLHAAMAAGKGRKRNSAAIPVSATQRSPVTPTTPTVPSSSDQQRHSPTHHVAPHNRNLDYPGLATHPYSPQLPVMSNTNYGHLYHNDVHGSFRAPSVESSSSHHSFQHQDFHPQSFPPSGISVPTHSQSFQPDGSVYHQHQRQHPSSLPPLTASVSASARSTGQFDSFRNRADSPNSATSGISPVSAIPALPTPPPAHGVGSSARSMDTRHSQQHGSFPFQHYAHQQHQHQYQHQHQHQHQHFQRSESGSPVEGRSIFTGTAMESSHGQFVREGSTDGSGSYGDGETGSVLESRWGSSTTNPTATTGSNPSATSYVTLSSSHGIDSRGGGNESTGGHSFRHSHEHGPSFLGSGYALPSLPSIVGSGSNGPFSSSFVGNYGEGEFGLPFPVYC